MRDRGAQKVEAVLSLSLFCSAAPGGAFLTEQMEERREPAAHVFHIPFKKKKRALKKCPDFCS